LCAIRGCGARGEWAEVGEPATYGRRDSALDMIDGALEKPFRREDLRAPATKCGG
jgi:hypothetical protein